MPDSGTRLPSRCVVMLSSVSYIDRQGHLVNESAAVSALLQATEPLAKLVTKASTASETHQPTRTPPAANSAQNRLSERRLPVGRLPRGVPTPPQFMAGTRNVCLDFACSPPRTGPPRSLKLISANSYFAAGAAAVTFVNVVSMPDVHVLPPSVDDSNLSVYCVSETSFSVTRVFMDLPSIIISLVHVQVLPLTVPFAVISSPQLSNAL